MVLKDPLDSLSKVAVFSGNIGIGLLSTKSISSDFFLKFAVQTRG